MKRLDFFCTSRASTAVCSSLDSRPVAGHGHRHRPHVDERRKGQLHVPCLSRLPITPKPHFEKHRKSTSCATAKRNDHGLRRKSCADVDDLNSPPAGSSARYLLGDSSFIDWFPASSAEDFPAEQPVERKSMSLVSNGYSAQKSSLTRSITVHEYRGLKSPSSSAASLTSTHESSPVVKSTPSVRLRNQVVVLKVSLHCKGCEEKVKRHISKMEGVTSFSVDFTTKKVTIIGDVTPFGVLASVSKVKHAQLWPSPTSSSSSSSSSSSTPQSSASSSSF